MLAEANISPELSTLLMTERAAVAALAESWLAQGAASFSIHDAEANLVAIWPKDTPPPVVTPHRIRLKFGGRVVGALWVDMPDNDITRQRLRADALLLGRVLDLETELENMTSDLVDALDRNLAFQHLNQSMRRLLDMPTTLEKLAQETTHVVNVEVIFVVLHGPARQNLVIQHPPEAITQAVLNTVLDDETHSERLLDDFPASSTIRNLYLMPITVQGRVVATMGFANNPQGFGSPEKKQIKAIADVASAQLEKVILYEENLVKEREQAHMEAERQAAAKIQTYLLPQSVPAINGLQIAAQSIQARQVGGDFYDFIQAPGQPFTFTVGDVAGKGMPSALLMANTQAVIRSRANTIPMSAPGHIITQSNADLYDSYTNAARFTTAFVGQYDSGLQCLSYASAGQSPVIYRPYDGWARLLPAPDMPLGVLADTVFENRQIAFRPGDVLVVATDGFSEASSTDGELFGYDRLLELVDQCALASAAEISARLFQAIGDYSRGHAQDDDQTLVVIKGAR